MNFTNQICRFYTGNSKDEHIGYLEKNEENLYVLKVDRFIWDLPVTSEYDFVHTKINGKNYTFSVFKKAFNIQMSQYYNDIKCEYHINRIFEGTYNNIKELKVNNMSLHFNNLLKWYSLDNKKFTKNIDYVSYVNFLSNKNNTDELVGRIKSFNKIFSNMTISRRNLNLSLYIRYHTFKKTNSSLPYFLEQEPMISLKYKNKVDYNEFVKDMNCLKMLIYLLFNKVELYKISSKLNEYPSLHDGSLTEVILPDMPEKSDTDNKPLFYVNELKDANAFFNTWFSFYNKFYTMLILYTSLADLDNHPELVFINYVKSLEFFVSNTNNPMNISFKLSENFIVKDDSKWAKRNKNQNNYDVKDLFKENNYNHDLIPSTKGMFIILLENFKIDIIIKLVEKLYENYYFLSKEDSIYTEKIMFISKLLRNTRNYYTHPQIDDYYEIINKNDLEYAGTLLKCLIEACILYELKFSKNEINKFLTRRYEKYLY
ncbi:MAG: hypothetical protein IJI98_03230 [Methanosphaera sp.]|nr:hypothetical protein [Methanosphaera sp.]